MSATAVTQAVRQRQAAKLQADTAKYQELVELSAKGGEVDPDDVLEVLNSTGYTAEEFSQAVALQEQRLAWAAQIAAAPAQLQRREKLTADLQAKVADFEAVERQHHSECKTLSDEIDRLSADLNRADDAERSLRENPKPSLEAARAEAMSKITPLRLERRDLRRDRQHLAENIASHPQALLHVRDAERRRELEELAAESKSKLAAMDARLAAIETALAPLEKQLAAIEAEVVNP